VSTGSSRKRLHGAESPGTFKIVVRPSTECLDTAGLHEHPLIQVVGDLLIDIWLRQRAAGSPTGDLTQGESRGKTRPPQAIPAEERAA